MLRLAGGTTIAGLLLTAVLPVCAQYATPQITGNYAAKVVSLSGSVSIVRDNQPWALSLGEAIQMKVEVVSGPDGHAVFQVSDGSTFEVFPNSRFIFRNNPGNWRDLVDVFIGRLKVRIQHWGDQPNRNQIHTPSAVISVRGTTFEVVVNEEEATVIDVEDGLVDVRHALLPTDRQTTLKAGDRLTVYKNVPIAVNFIDRGTVIQYTMRSIVDALKTLATSGPRPGTGIGGGGGGPVADPKRPAPPPPPPPPPPR